MAEIRINQLPLATGGTAPVANDAVAIDGSTTRKTTIQTLVETGRPVATQAEAEEGINSSKAMTPLTTAQAIAAIGATEFASTAQGVLADSAMQPSVYDPSGIGASAFARVNHTGLYPDIYTIDTVINIPAQYPTWQAAIEALGNQPVSPGKKIELRLASGFVISTGLILTRLDASRFVLTSVDAEVPLSSGFNTNVIRGNYADMPTLGCLINAQNQTAGDGIYLTGDCTMVVNAACGVKNAWGNGILARGGPVVYGQSSLWTGNARNATTGSGITVWGAYMDATSADVSNCGYYGAQAAHGGTLTFEFGIANNVFRYAVRASDAACIDFSDGQANNAGVYGIYSFQNSHINAPGATATGCGAGAASVGLEGANACCNNGSTLNIRAATLTGSIGHGLLTVAGKVDAFNANFSSANLDGVNAIGAEVHAGGAQANTCRRGFMASQASIIAAGVTTANSCRDTGYYAERASVIDARQGSATGCTNYGGLANEAATLNLRSATLTGAGTGGVRALESSIINVTLANCRKGAVDDTGTNTADIQVFSGSQITATSATGGANRATNAVTANGIMYR